MGPSTIVDESIVWFVETVTCGRHPEQGDVDLDCADCALERRGAEWVAWLDDQIVLLDNQLMSVEEQLEIVTSARDDLSESLSHHQLTAETFNETIRPFTAPPPPTPEPATNGHHNGATVGHHTSAPTDAPVVVPTTPPLSPPVLLSAVGVLLLLAAAIVFTAVRWNTLGAGWQSVVMVTATTLAVAVTVVSQRRGLRWTAEALSWLAAAFGVVDVVTAAHYDIVLGNAAPEIVIAAAAVAVVVIGFVVAVLTGVGESDASETRPARVENGASARAIARDLRNHVGGHALVAPWVQGPLAIVVAAGALAVRAGELRWAPVTASVAVLLIVAAFGIRSAVRRWWAAPALLALAVSVVVSIQFIDGTAEPLLYATTVTMLVLALGTWAYRVRRDPTTLPVATGLSLLVLFALLAAHTASCDRRAQIIIAVVLGAVAAATTLIERFGIRQLASAAAGVAVVGAIAPMLDESVTGSVAAAVVALVGVAWLQRSETRDVAGPVAVGAGLIFTGYLSNALGLRFGWSALVTAVLANAALAVVVLRDERPLTSDSSSDAASDDSTAVERWRWSSPASPIAVTVAMIALFATLTTVDVLSAFVAASLVAAATGYAIATLTRRTNVRWVAIVITAVTFGVGWAELMWVLDVTVPEGYGLPIAAAWAALGVWSMYLDYRVASWIALGPALAVAALPTTAVLMDGDDGLTRALSMVVVGAVVAIVGAWRHLQAPLVGGSAAAAFAALTQVGPWVGALPRWLTLGLVGVALVISGARFESVRDGAKRVTTSLGRLR